jgi:hypothetical protein
MSVTFHGDTLTVDGREFRLEAEIETAIEANDRIYVLFNDETYPEHDWRARRNVVALRRDGSEIWRIGTSEHLFPQVKRRSLPFMDLTLEFRGNETVLEVWEAIGMLYDVDPDTGELSNPVQSKF